MSTRGFEHMMAHYFDEYESTTDSPTVEGFAAWLYHATTDPRFSTEGTE